MVNVVFWKSIPHGVQVVSSSPETLLQGALKPVAVKMLRGRVHANPPWVVTPKAATAGVALIGASYRSCGLRLRSHRQTSNAGSVCVRRPKQASPALSSCPDPHRSALLSGRVLGLVIINWIHIRSFVRPVRQCLGARSRSGVSVVFESPKPWIGTYN